MKNKRNSGVGWDVGGSLKKEGTYVYLWLDVWQVDVWQKSTQYCNYPSIKNKRIKKKTKRIKQKLTYRETEN